jgi:uncharacterized protein YyaL (SSP411 family)
MLGAQPASQTGDEALSPEVLDQATRSVAQSYDWQNGGWGGAPKFPQPMLVEFLLRRGSAGDQSAIDMATHALRSMAQGGMYDLLGGGFARYSVDPTWHIPHFEKMLYDNAQLALANLHANLLTGEPSFRSTCEATLDFVLRELTHPDGGFFSSLDADSEGEEGKYYLWTPAEVRSALPDAHQADLFLAAYGVSESGNFEGKCILRRALTDEQLSGQFDLPLEAIPAKLASLRRRLLEVRSSRVRPGTDDKVLVFWNALMLAAFAEAGRALGRQDYTGAAIKNASFLLGNLIQDGRLLRSWREGHARHDAYLEDYAGLALGLLALYQSDPNPRWYQAALKLVQEMLAHFSDPSGGFFDTRDDHEALLYRPKDQQDNATPCGNALAATALLHLSAYEGQSDWRELAEGMLSANLGMLKHYPTAFAQWLCAADFALGPVHEVAILGDPADPANQGLLQALWRGYHPRLVLAASPYPPAEGSPALLKDRPLLNGKPAAYVCQGFVCRQPVNDPELMLEQLKV